MERSNEWKYVSTDATLKVCKHERDSAPFGDDEALRRLLTVRGRTGGVLLMKPTLSETSELIAQAFQTDFSPLALQSIEYIATDSPSSKFYLEMKAVSINLSCVCLDAIHLAIVYEYAQWRKRTPGSKCLRRVLRKILMVDPAMHPGIFGDMFDGSNAKRLSTSEDKIRNSIRDMSMGRTTAKRILSNLDTSTPFIHRRDFFDCLAAVTATYTDEVCRKVPGPNREVSHVLWTACAPDRIEWLWNNMRLRHRISPAELALLPSGTASNESLHAEINSWTQSIIAMHRLRYNPNCK